MPRRPLTDATEPWTVDHAVIRAAVIAPLACLAAVPLCSLAAPGVGLPARLLVLAVIGLAVARPPWALLVCAGFVSLAAPLGTVLGAPFGLGEPLVLAFISGWLAHEALWPRRTEPAVLALVIPALLFAATVAVSCAVPLLHPPSAAGSPLLSISDVWAFVTREYFIDHSRLQTITSGMLLLESTAAFAATVTLADRTRDLAVQVARVVVACAAGVATLNVARLFMVSLRGNVSIADLTLRDAPIRISYVFPDVNAAGSYFAMTLLLAGGLFVADRRLRPAWGVALAVIAGALWLAGSRTALVAVPLAVACVLLLDRLRARSWRHWAVAGLIVLLLLGAAVARFNRLGDLQRPLATAWSVRVEMGRAALRMFAARPVFGVGVGRFYPLSADFSSPEVQQLYPHENAHNNFLQILAELGIVGFAQFIWILVEVARRIWNVAAGGRAGPVLRGTAGGLAAFLLTCLAGHPLLVHEVSYAFWITLGLPIGLLEGAARSRTRGAGVTRWDTRTLVAAGVALIVAVSLPVRARQMVTESGRATAGLSEWQTDEEGKLFRWMDAGAEFSIPASGRAVTLPLRLDPSAPRASCAVDIRVDGHAAFGVQLTDREWHDFRFVTPKPPPDVHFLRIELRVSACRADEGTRGEISGTPSRLVRVGQPVLTR